jgi:glycosyltransferase involved in cell wall biosynthesis
MTNATGSYIGYPAMSSRGLRIAWIGAGPGSSESGGVPGVATELLLGLTRLGHEIDCYLPGTERALPKRIVDAERVTVIWGIAKPHRDRWYSRTGIGAFLAGLVSRGVGSVHLRRALVRRHEQEPYDVIYQFSNIEALAMPGSLRDAVPLVIHPETHIAGELRLLLAERRLSLRCQPVYVFVLTVCMMLVRVVVQRRRVRTASLLVCISSVFRDHLLRDYRFPLERTVVIPNPVRLERFTELDISREMGRPPTVLVLGRVAARKGVEDVVAMAWRLQERGVDVRIRVVGGPSLWSDYSALLADLPPASCEYAGRISPADIPAELERADVLLQASKYEPFGLTVGEALAAGVPVVATSEVGAIEQIDRAVVAEVAPGNVAGLASAVTEILARLEEAPAQMRALARSEAQRRFAPQLVSRQISVALQQLVERRGRVQGAAVEDPLDEPRRRATG